MNEPMFWIGVGVIGVETLRAGVRWYLVRKTRRELAALIALSRANATAAGEPRAVIRFEGSGEELARRVKRAADPLTSAEDGASVFAPELAARLERLAAGEARAEELARRFEDLGRAFKTSDWYEPLGERHDRAADVALRCENLAEQLHQAGRIGALGEVLAERAALVAQRFEAIAGELQVWGYLQDQGAELDIAEGLATGFETDLRAALIGARIEQPAGEVLHPSPSRAEVLARRFERLAAQLDQVQRFELAADLDRTVRLAARCRTLAAQLHQVERFEVLPEDLDRAVELAGRIEELAEQLHPAGRAEVLAEGLERAEAEAITLREALAEYAHRPDRHQAAAEAAIEQLARRLR